MTIEEIIKDVENIRITEFMEAIGEKPVAKDGNILIYNAPYNIEELCMDGINTAGKPTCLVDTERNLWRDSNYTPWLNLRMLALECTWVYDPDKLNYIIADNILEFRKSKEAQVNTETENVHQEQKKGTDWSQACATQTKATSMNIDEIKKYIPVFFLNQSEQSGDLGCK